MPLLGDSNKSKLEWTEAELIHIEKMASTGLGISDIAEFLCVADSSFRNHLKAAQEEAENFKGNARRKAELLDQNIYYRHSRGVQAHKLLISKGLTEHALKGNPNVLIFLAKSKLGWNDKILPEDPTETNSQILEGITVEFIEP